MALRSEGQTLRKKKNIAERHAQRFFFSLQSVSMTLAQRYEWSGTPLTAGQGPAAAHCAELRSFRRGCMALRSREDTV